MWEVIGIGIGRVEKLTVEEKIKVLRKLKKVDQKELAQIIGRETNTIYRAEKGERVYTEEELDLIKESFGMSEAPLTEMELEICKERLYVWRERIREDLLDEAQRLRSKLEIITELPFEHNLAMLFKAINVRMLLKSNDISAASSHLKYLEPLVSDAPKEVEYHFLYAEGLYAFYNRDYKAALTSFLKALNLDINEFELVKEDALHYNIALCHSKLGMYFMAATSYLKIYSKFNHDRVNTTGMLLENSLAVDYMRLGHTGKAKKLFNKVLVKARVLEADIFIGHTLHNLGCIYSSSKEQSYKKALSYFDKALAHYESGSGFYLECMYFKIRCLIFLKSFESSSLLTDIESLTKNNAHYSMLFNSLSHLATLKEEVSAEYIENITIPYLLGEYEYFKALDFCEALEKRYDDNFTKLAKFKAITDDIQKRMHREEIEYKE